MTTLEKLKLKSQDQGRMPSIKEIAKLLDDNSIPYYLADTNNIVEYKDKWANYVNSRHYGKSGKRLLIREANIDLDTSDSYYSWNSWQYAGKIIDFLATKGIA